MSQSITFLTMVSGIVAGSGTKTVTDDSAVIANPASVSAAQPATLTTRTSNTAGTLTMTNASHGVTTGMRLDFYWTGGSCFGVTAGTVSGTSVPFTLVQGGDVLPVANTAITVGKCEQVTFAVTGDLVSGLVCGKASAAVRCRYTFTETLGVLALSVLNQSGESFVWNGINTSTGPIGSGSGNSPGGRNPLADTEPTDVYISHADTAAADTSLICAVVKQ